MPVRPRLPATKTPWPMKWVALAILVFIVPYTWLTLHFRKPGPAYEPAAAMEKRAAGWQRLDSRVERPADPAHARTNPGPDATIADAPGGLPDGLAQPWPLPAEITAVGAAAEGSLLSAYQINFVCALPAADQQLAGAQIFKKGDHLVVVTQFEPIANGLRARSSDTVVLLTVPAGVLKPGHYTVTVAASARAKQWTLDVK